MATKSEKKAQRSLLELAAAMTGGPLAEYWCHHCGQQIEDPDERCDHCGRRRGRND